MEADIKMKNSKNKKHIHKRKNYRGRMQNYRNFYNNPGNAYGAPVDNNTKANSNRETEIQILQFVVVKLVEATEESGEQKLKDQEMEEALKKVGNVSEEARLVANEVFESFGGFFKLEDCITASQDNFCDIEDTVEQLIQDSIRKVIFFFIMMMQNFIIIILTTS